MIMLSSLSEEQIVSQFLKQMRTVRDFGRYVTKPEDGDDDLFRCVVLAWWAMNTYKDRFNRTLFGPTARKRESEGSHSFINLNTLHDVKPNQHVGPVESSSSFVIRAVGRRR